MFRYFLEQLGSLQLMRAGDSGPVLSPDTLAADVVSLFMGAVSIFIGTHTLSLIDIEVSLAGEAPDSA